ncbi:hypothetical protein AALA22_10360 [Anaerovoracaceae bacterium 41-7]
MVKTIEEEVKKIQIDRIGDSCFYDAASCILEYTDRLYWALDYVEYKFLYNFDSFIKFNKKESFVLSPTDNYYFLSGTGSRIYKANSKYTYSNYKDSLENAMKYREKNSKNFYDILNFFSKKDVPFMLKVNNMEYKQFYKENRFTVPRSDCRHLIDVLKVSEDGRSCFIFDRGFDCFGKWIDAELLYKGATSSFLNNFGKISYMFFSEDLPPILNTNEIRQKFIDNVKRTLKSDIIIDKNIYFNNSKALYAFRNDFKQIVEVMEHRYGQLTAAMIGEAILLQVDGSMGVVGLYRYINTFIDSIALKNILPEVRNYWEIWHKFETRLKYVTYKNEPLHNYTELFITYIDELIESDDKIIKGIKMTLAEIS